MPEDPTTAHPDWHEADPDVYVDLDVTADMRPDFVVPLPLWAQALAPGPYADEPPSNSMRPPYSPPEPATMTSGPAA